MANLLEKLYSQLFGRREDFFTFVEGDDTIDPPVEDRYEIAPSNLYMLTSSLSCCCLLILVIVVIVALNFGSDSDSYP